MKISVIIEEKTHEGRQFLAASAKGQYLGEKFDQETRYFVKVAKGTWNSFVAASGIYAIECEDAWKDARPETTHPTVWLKNISKVEKKAELKKFDK